MGAPQHDTDREVPGGAALELIRGPLPAEVERAATAVADNPFACLLHVRAFHPELVAQLHHLVVRAGGTTLGVLSFRDAGRRLVVANQCVAFPGGVLDACVLRLFAEYPGARRIDFADVYDTPETSGGTRLPSLRVAMGMYNFAVRLPATVEEYDGRTFSAKTLRKFRNYERRLAAECDDPSFAIVPREAIDAALVDEIVRLHHLRMDVKGTQSLVDDDYAAKLLALCRACGVVGVYRSGTRILAAAICNQVGNGWSLQVIAHDRAFDPLSLGFLCLVRTVEAAIAARAATFNLLWGASAYKTRLGAERIPLRHRYFYRSKLARALALDIIVPKALKSAKRRMRSLLAKKH